jgi:hypothetical protein
MAHFQARLDHLFQTVQAPGGGEYTYRQVAAGIEKLVGYKTSSSYLQELRAGLRISPSMKYLHGLSAFFGVPVAYFFDEDQEARANAQLELATALRDQPLRELALQAAGLSADMLDAITRIVENARRIEGLDPVARSAPAPGESAPRPPSRRRGRRRGQHDEQTNSPDTVPPTRDAL